MNIGNINLGTHLRANGVATNFIFLFDEAAMLHIFRDCLFRSDSQLQRQFSNLLEQIIAERIASRQSE